MYHHLSHAEVERAADVLADAIGIKEAVAGKPLLKLVADGATEQCVQQIAAQLALPIRACVAQAPRSTKPGDKQRFTSSALSRTDAAGRGIEAIEAQVKIPSILPLYGSSNLDGFPIEIHIDADWRHRPAAFILVMAHELSHVLLRVIRFPVGSLEELYADLAPLLLGFAAIIKVGRKSSDEDVTTTFGYLTDGQFKHVCGTIQRRLTTHLHAKKELGEQMAAARRCWSAATANVAQFRARLQAIDARPPKKVRPADVAKLVECHHCDYTRAWEQTLAAGKTALDAAQQVVEPIVHYTAATMRAMAHRRRQVDLLLPQLEDVERATAADVAILNRYRPLLAKVRNCLKLRRKPAKP